LNAFLKDKVALVTGAGRGIGQACAIALAREGCRVALVSRTKSEVDAVASQIRAFGGAVFSAPVDVANEASVLGLFRDIRKQWGIVEILVNNAAVFFKAEVAQHGVREWDDVMAVNVRGVFLCSRQVFRDCEAEKRPASIVNIASLAGVRGTEKFPGLSSYVASKFAVIGMTESFAVEGKAHGIRVNCVAPGAVDTEMLRKAAPLLKTHTMPEHIAKTVVHLADAHQSSHLSGSVIEVFSNA
jgi:NAD(P)-dependent dehydrogenase (short-subunit alcohol dehydrogenase family)